MISKNQMKLIRSLELKKNRKRENLFVAEGPKVVGDLLRGGYLPHSIFSTGQQIEAGGRRYEVGGAGDAWTRQGCSPTL